MINEKLKEVSKYPLVNVGTCNLHVVHNAFFKGLKAYGMDVSDLVVRIYSFFDGWPVRCNEYSKIQIEKSVKPLKFLKHVPSRWLTLKPAIERIIEQMPALKEYFLKFLPLKKSKNLSDNYLYISKKLEDIFLAPKLLLIVERSAIFENFSKIFQKEDPQIHKLFEELVRILILINHKICSTRIDSIDDYEKLNFEDLSRIRDVRCNEKLENALLKLKELDIIEFKKMYLCHYSASANYLLKYVSKNEIRKLRNFRNLMSIKEKNFNEILEMNKILTLNADEDLLRGEWLLLKNESIIDSAGQSYTSLDNFWSQIFNLKKFPILENLLTRALIMAHGNADVERGFSISGKIMSDDKSRMSCLMLNSRLYIKNGMKNYNNKAENIIFTQRLYQLAKLAHLRYTERLTEKKNNETEVSIINDNVCLKNNNFDSKVNKIVLELKQCYQKDSHSLTNYLNEVNSRLKNAISTKNFEEIQICQSILEIATKLNENKNQSVDEVLKQFDTLKRKSTDCAGTSKKLRKS